MGQATLNAWKGYSFEKQVFVYLVLLMDIDSNIQNIEAEVGTDVEHKFDDIRICTNSTEYAVQVKNLSDNDLSLDTSKHKIHHGTTTIDYTSVESAMYIYNGKQPKIEPNSKFFDHPAYTKDGVTLLNLSADLMWDCIDQNFANKNRITSILRTIDRKLSDGQNMITRLDLPSFSYFSTTLSEETHKIRKYILSSDAGTIWVFGKPGVGKSHLINEMDVEENRIYRFWISEDDIHRHDRLGFVSFLNELSTKIFGDNKSRTDEILISALISSPRYFYIDGFDHVENYNPGELNKYTLFFEKLVKENARIVFLSRPLKVGCFNNINTKIELGNWNEDETFEFCKYEAISDFTVQNEIYRLSNGYPILTRYIVEEYKNNRILPTRLSQFTSLSEYYDQLISDESIKPILKILSSFPVYFTIDEIKNACNDSADIISAFVNNRKFLFICRKNRFYFFHDSFIKYLNEIPKSEPYVQFVSRLNLIIETSVINGHPEYMSRLYAYDTVSSDFLTRIFIIYSDINRFSHYTKNTLDYDSIASLYGYIRRNIKRTDLKARTPRRLYDIVLISLILSRDNIEDNYSFLYQLWRYFAIHNINYADIIFSNGSMFGAFLYFDDFDLHRFINDDLLRTGYRKSRYEIDDSVESEINFFDQFTSDKTDEITSILTRNRDEFINDAGDYKLRNLLVNIWVHHHYEHELYSHIDSFFNGVTDYQTLRFYYEQYLRKHKNRDKYHLLSTEQSAKHLILELGYLPNCNKYLNETIKNICISGASQGSWEVLKDLTALIRLANKNKKSLDIVNLYLFFPMYYNHKDYSVYHLPEVLFDTSFIESKKSIANHLRWIDKLQDMSDKGIRDLYCNYINLFCTKNSFKLRKLGAFNADNHRLYISGLSKETLNQMSEEEVIRTFLKSVSYVTRSIDLDDIQDLIISKHWQTIEEIISNHRIKVDKKTDSKGGLASLADPQKPYSVGERFKEGYLDETELDYIMQNKVSIEEISMMHDGNLSALPFPDIFLSFSKREVELKCLELITNAISTRTRFDYGTNLWVALYTVARMVLRYKKTSKSAIRNSVKMFIAISLVEPI